MEYSIWINQKTVVEHGYHDVLDLELMALLTWTKKFLKNAPCRKFTERGKVFGWISYGKVAEELPLMKSTTASSISRRMSVLVDNGFLEREQRGKDAYFHVTDKAMSLFTQTEEKTVAKMQQHRCKNATNHDTNNHNETDGTPEGVETYQRSPARLRSSLRTNLPDVSRMLGHYQKSNMLRKTELKDVGTVGQIMQRLYADLWEHEVARIRRCAFTAVKSLSARRNIKDHEYYLYTVVKKLVERGEDPLWAGNPLGADMDWQECEEFEQDFILHLSETIKTKVYEEGTTDGQQVSTERGEVALPEHTRGNVRGRTKHPDIHTDRGANNTRLVEKLQREIREDAYSTREPDTVLSA